MAKIARKRVTRKPERVPGMTTPNPPKARKARNGGTAGTERAKKTHPRFRISLRINLPKTIGNR